MTVTAYCTTTRFIIIIIIIIIVNAVVNSTNLEKFEA